MADNLHKRFDKLETELRQTLSNLLAKFGAKLLEVSRRLDAHDEQLDDHEERITAIERVTRWMPKRRTSTGELRGQQRQEAAVIIRRMDAHFNESELIELCFDFGLDYENLSGDGKRRKIRQMATHFLRRNTLGLLVMWLKEIRPGVEWPVID